jgi:hypothetical protein
MLWSGSFPKNERASEASRTVESFNRLPAHCGRVTLELYRKRAGATVSVSWTSGVRFRYSRLKEAALFAVDAMGFQKAGYRFTVHFSTSFSTTSGP